MAFLKAALEGSPHPVLVLAHHVLPVRRVEQLNAMIGAGSGSTREVMDAVMASGEVVFWGWIHQPSPVKRGRVRVGVAPAPFTRPKTF